MASALFTHGQHASPAAKSRKPNPTANSQQPNGQNPTAVVPQESTQCVKLRRSS